MAGLGDIFSKEGVVYQMFVWGVVQQIVSALAAPYFSDLSQLVNAEHPVEPLSAAEAATAVNRNFIDLAAGEEYAAKSGIPKDVFGVLRHLAGDAPSPTTLAEGLRRGLLNYDSEKDGIPSFKQGIAEGNLLDIWAPLLRDLAQQWPTPAFAATAALKGQVLPDEGKALYEKFGGDPQWWQLVFDTEGSAPTPLEAVQMAMRGFMPWTGEGPQVTSYAQAFHEGPWRDKWLDIYQKNAAWYPTASEALELYRYGQISQDRAAKMLAERGINAEDSAAWLGYARMNAVTDYRGLTESAVLEQVELGYITDAQATTMLTAVHKGPEAIKQLIAYAHIRKAITSLTRAIDRIGTLYQGRKITISTARDALTGLNVPSQAIQGILEDWSAVAGVNVKTLTESQIVDAWEYKVLDTAEAMTELENIGYTPFDAWTLMSNKAKTPLPGKPAKGPAPPIGAVTPGTT